LDLFETMCRLCGQGAPSGFEEPAARTAQALLEPLVDEVSVDRLGNVAGIKRCGAPEARRLLLDAHLDEVGLIVTGVENGFLRFACLGGVDPRVLPDREVSVLAGPEPLFGVVACLPPHLQSETDRDTATRSEKMCIDIGMSQEQALQAVPIGTPVVFRSGLFRLRNGQVCGKSLDDRSCFAVLLRTAQLLQNKPLDVDVYFMGSVREETGGAGAGVGTVAAAPDWCVATDVTFARTPGLSAQEVPCRLYGGPAIGLGPNMTWSLTERMTEKAKQLGIPFQYEVMEGNTGTNGWQMQTCLAGIPTAVVSLPLKYMHTPVEVVALDDMENTARLLAAFAQGLGREGC